MKTLKIPMFLVVVLMLSACVVAPVKRTCEESCALDGMVCTGQSVTESSSQNDHEAFGKMPITQHTRAYSYHCAKDESKIGQIKEIQARIAAEEKEKAAKKAAASANQ